MYMPASSPTGISFTVGGVETFGIQSTGITAYTQFLATAAGNATRPAIAFSGDTDTGVYRSGAADRVGIAAGGAAVAIFANTNVLFSRALLIPNGTSAAPSIAFENDTESGLYQFNTGGVSISCEGADTATFTADITALSSSQVLFANGGLITPSIAFVNDLSTGLYYSGAEQLGIVGGGTQVITFGTNVVLSRALLAPDGTDATPALAFSSDPDTGLYLSASNRLAISAGGTRVAAFTTNVVLDRALLAPDGAVAAPSLAFSNDPDTGFYRTGTNAFAASAGGTAVITVTSQFVSVPSPAGLRYYNPYAASMEMSGPTQVVGNGTTVIFATPLYDTGGLISSPTAMTVTRSGVYSIFTMGGFQNSTGGTLRRISIFKNGDTAAISTWIVANDVPFPRGTVSFLGPLATNDYVSIFVYQNTGGNLTYGKISGSEGQAVFTLNYLGDYA
jgi:hypothetical protein